MGKRRWSVMRYLRSMTEEGESKFQEYLKNIQNIPKKKPPDLNKEPFSEDISSFIPVSIDENKLFSTKTEMAEYLANLFGGVDIGMADLIEENRLWTWLAYVWFDQVCPIEDDGRSPGQRERYICGRSYSSYTKHLVAFPYYVYSLHGKKRTKLFLEHPLDYVGDVTEQLGSNKYIMSSKNIMEALHRLYWDKENNQTKTGAMASNAPGTFRRFNKVTNQLKLTYDLHDMDPDKIIDVLPSEFDRWLE